MVMGLMTLSNSKRKRMGSDSKKNKLTFFKKEWITSQVSKKIGKSD